VLRDHEPNSVALIQLAEAKMTIVAVFSSMCRC